MKPPLPFFKTGHARVLTLELQSKTRDCWALSYAYLPSVHYDVTGSIELQFSSAKVVIEGQQLKSLYDALKEQTVVSIREADAECERSSGGVTFIQSISVSPTA
jgi:predicted trehalose synthase